ncbi:MAG: acyl carrier protein [Caulobacteraceae bacterium]
MYTSQPIKLEEIISDYIVRNVNLTQIDNDMRIFESGLVNSLFAIELMTFLEKSFGIKIRIDDLDMENFQSVNLIVKFVENKLKGEKNV